MKNLTKVQIISLNNRTKRIIESEVSRQVDASLRYHRMSIRTTLPKNISAPYSVLIINFVILASLVIGGWKFMNSNVWTESVSEDGRVQFIFYFSKLLKNILIFSKYIAKRVPGIYGAISSMIPTWTMVKLKRISEGGVTMNDLNPLKLQSKNVQAIATAAMIGFATNRTQTSETILNSSISMLTKVNGMTKSQIRKALIYTNRNLQISGQINKIIRQVLKNIGIVIGYLMFKSIESGKEAYNTIKRSKRLAIQNRQ